jgi:hypothetical protein
MMIGTPEANMIMDPSQVKGPEDVRLKFPCF